MSKSKKKTALFGTKEATNLFIDYLLAQSSVLKGAVLTQFQDKRTKELKIILGSITQTATALAILCKNSLSNEATMLARSIVEKTINYCFLLVCDKKDYQDYMKYSIQKVYRKLDRELVIGDRKIETKYDENVKLPKEVVEAINKFTGSKGGEITRWTKISLDKRLELIANRTSLNIGLIMLFKLSVYEDASEALHGTFYGCAFHTGYHLPEFKSKDRKSAESREQKNLSLLCVNCGAVITELLKILNKYESVGDFYKKSKINTKNCLELMKAVTQ